MSGGYLIPANSKKSMLILSFFTPFDLMVFGFGVGFSVLLLLIVNTQSLGLLLLMLTPGLISTFLVLPIPNYHNVMTLIMVVYQYFTNRRRYVWRGWCVSHGEKSS